jgi:hypothetical protein
MTELNFDSFPKILGSVVPGFDRVYDEHVADNGGVLPHVLVGELVRFLVSQVEASGASSSALRAAMPLLEDAMAGSDARLQELIAVSFIENLDPGDHAFAVIRGLFGPKLEEQYDNWQRGSMVEK